MSCELVRIRGDVQGVCFRHYARREAERLGISGWVKNVSDGSVEALICGGDTQLATMREWLARGPPSAEVLDIRAETYQGAPCPSGSFRIVY